MSSVTDRKRNMRPRARIVREALLIFMQNKNQLLALWRTIRSHCPNYKPLHLGQLLDDNSLHVLRYVFVSEKIIRNNYNNLRWGKCNLNCKIILEKFNTCDSIIIYRGKNKAYIIIY